MNLRSKRHAVDVLHGNKVRAVGYPDLVDMSDIRMIKRRGRFCLTGKTAHPLFVGRDVRRQNLQSNGTPKLHIARQVNLSHATLAQRSKNLVASQVQLSLRDPDGQKRQLSELKGRVVVVNFWATWCGPCKAEMPEFTKVHAAYRDRGVEFVGASADTRADRAKVLEFVQSHAIQFPIWLEASLDHLEAFGVAPVLPATVMVDAQGRIAARIKGPTDAARLRALLDQLLLESSAAAGSGARP